VTSVALGAGGALSATESWPALGTTAVLRTHGGSGAAARAAAEREIEAFDRAASRFRSDSEISRVNRADGRRTPVSTLLLEALRLAVRAAELTEGAVDPTLADRLVALGYDRDWAQLSPVGPAEPFGLPLLAAPARPRTSWRSIELCDKPPAVRLPAGMQLDLGATAKALAADRAARAAHLASTGDVLLGLGGDIASGGQAPPEGWLIRVTDDHRDADEGSGQRITITSGGVATSSLMARRWYHRGRAVHHVLDPRTGDPVEPVWRTVSVAAATCADANIASTAALVLGDRAVAWLAERALPARLVRVDGTVETHGGWPR
jgi:thiamine biosynthesis lipoprotein